MLTDFNPEYWEIVPIDAMRPHIYAANHVLFNHPHTGWDEEEMKKFWRKRSSDEINCLNGIFPCFDSEAKAAEYNFERGVNSRLRMVTDAKVVDLFRSNDSDTPCLHIDTWGEIDYNGSWFGMNKGSGDCCMVYPTKESKPRDEYPDEEVFGTTRPEAGDRLWYRKTVLLIPARTIAENPKVPLLEFMNHPDNMVKVPMGLTPDEFRKVKIHYEVEHRIFRNNKVYNVAGASEYNSKWTSDFNSYWLDRALREGKPTLPELLDIRYI